MVPLIQSSYWYLIFKIFAKMIFSLSSFVLITSLKQELKLLIETLISEVETPILKIESTMHNIMAFSIYSSSKPYQTQAYKSQFPYQTDTNVCVGPYFVIPWLIGLKALLKLLIAGICQKFIQAAESHRCWYFAIHVRVCMSLLQHTYCFSSLNTKC